MNLRRLFTSSSIYLLGNLANRALSFLMIPLYTRLLSPAEYGTIEILELLVTVTVITLGASAIASSTIRIYHDEAEADRPKVISTAVISLLVVGLLVALFGMAISTSASSFLFRTPANENLIRLAFLATYLSILTELCLVYQRLKERASYFVKYSSTQLVASALLNLFFLVGMHAGVWSLFWSKLIVSMVGALLLLRLVLREVGTAWDPRIARKLARFGAPLVIAGASMLMIHSSDRYFLNRYVSLTDVGIYSMAYKFGFLVTYLVGEPFKRAWNATSYGYVGSVDWQHSFARIGSYLIFTLMLVSLALTLFRTEFLTFVAARDYRSAAAVIPILVASYTLRELGDFFNGVYLISKSRSRNLAGIILFSALVNIALNFLLIPTMGMIGAAWATFGTFAVYSGVICTVSQREQKLPLAVAPPVLLAMAALGLGFFDTWLGVSSVVLAGLVKLAELGLFTAVGVWLGLIPRVSLAELVAVVRGLNPELPSERKSTTSQ